MYRALYRKWRPRKFADVVGQEAIVTALQNQIAAGRIGHAYLFTGTRGTGKTTCAKIFAKAVNCLDTTSPDPCGECAVCKGIDEGTILDVSEIDAASNNSVDDIRDLRDETAYLPAVCKYKVYIIDEVHMLSTSAFNALLKTMEEPPEHVIFILATTEVQKVPATILSRCQRYDFQRITADKIAGRLEYVAGQENIELDHNAAELIGRLADGAMRDALSILDTCAGVSNTVDEALVRRMAGVTDRKYLFEISDAIAARDAVKALQEIAALRQQSVDMRRLCMELAGHYRNLMLSALPGGISVGEDGATHQCNEDIALMRTIPGMVVINPADATEAAKAVEAAIEHEGPVYLRFGRMAVPVLYGNDYDFKIGRGTKMAEGNDVSIICAGIMVEQALGAREILASEGICASVVNMATIKPIDEAMVIAEAQRCGAIVTAEEHSVIGGLGAAVCETLARTCPVPVIRTGIKDTFGKSGTAKELITYFGLDAQSIAENAKAAIALKK